MFIDFNTNWIVSYFGFLEEHDKKTFEKINEELNNGAMIFFVGEDDFMKQETYGNGVLIIVLDKVGEDLYKQENVLVVKTLSALALTRIEDLKSINKNIAISSLHLEKLLIQKVSQ